MLEERTAYILQSHTNDICAQMDNIREHTSTYEHE